MPEQPELRIFSNHIEAEEPLVASIACRALLVAGLFKNLGTAPLRTAMIFLVGFESAHAISYKLTAVRVLCVCSCGPHSASPGWNPGMSR